MRDARFVGLVLTVSLLAQPGVSHAADTWIEVKSPNFLVVSNAGDGRARDVAWQFEQIRAAIGAGWPWARVRLDRPVVVLALKDRASMRVVTPQYWERGQAEGPATVFVSTGGSHLIALRTDVQVENATDQDNANPYRYSYWSYSLLTLDAAFDRPLPLWIRIGLAQVLSNTMIRKEDVDIGRPMRDNLLTLQSESRLTLAELTSTVRDSAYFKDDVTRQRFDALSWVLVHYLLFGKPHGSPDKFNQMIKLLIEGQPSDDALRGAYGELAMLETAYLQYSRQPIFSFARMKADANIAKKGFASRTMAPAEASSAQARFLAASSRAVEARSLIAEARKASANAPFSYDVEAMLLEREGKPKEAQAAYAKAEELGSENFYTYYRLAALGLPISQDQAARARMETQLRRAVALNDVYAPALSLLAEVVVRGDQRASALDLATKAVGLAPASVSARLSVARVLWALSQPDKAKGYARAALALAREARDEQDQRAAQTLIDFFEKATAPAK